ncbi:MAG: thioredoxin family protein [Planctomycetales bacterium]
MPDTKRTRLAVNFPGRTFWGTVFSMAMLGCFADWAVHNQPVYGQAVNGQGTAPQASSFQGMVLDFSATWCGPCQQMSPIVARLEREHLPIRKVDVDQQRRPSPASFKSAQSRFILVVNGKEVQRLEGAQSEATIRQLRPASPGHSRKPY